MTVEQIDAVKRSDTPALSPRLVSNRKTYFASGDENVEKLFEMYECAGFLYPEKLKLLRPHMATILANWRAALRSRHDLMFVAHHPGQGSGHSSLSSFRSTKSGWHTQHLVSHNDRMGSMEVLLATCVERLQTAEEQSTEMWFRPDNKFANRVFGSMPGFIGPDATCLSEYRYCRLDVALARALSTDGKQVFTADRVSRADDAEYIAKTRGKLYASAEEFIGPDIGLETTGALYQEVGLFRRRYVFIVNRATENIPVGYCVAYRGPLGLNLSFLENRSEIALEPSLSECDARTATRVCLRALVGCYGDYEADWIPALLLNEQFSPRADSGLTILRTYRQLILAKDGYARWYQNVRNCFSRVLDRDRTEGNVPAHD